MSVDIFQEETRPDEKLAQNPIPRTALILLYPFSSKKRIKLAFFKEVQRLVRPSPVE